MSDGEKPQSTKNRFQQQLRALKENRFDPKRKVEIPVSILELKDVTVCTEQNICNIQGPAKSAKSAVMGAAVAAILRALLGKPEHLEETLGFSSKLPKNGEKQRQHILHFDTEQSSYHHHKLGMDVLARADVTKTEYDSLPFHSYSLISVDLPYRQQMILDQIAEIEGPEDSLACLVIDGIADIISDPNDGKISNELVAWLHGLAKDKRLAVITILHENPGDTGKARGHLGSQILRKTETNLRVRKGGSQAKDGAQSQDKAISTIWVERARGGHIAEKDGVKISWCESKKRHTIHDPSRGKKKAEVKEAPAAEPKSSELTRPQQKTKEWLTKVLKDPMPYSVLVPLVERQQRCKERTAKTRIEQWVALGFLHKTATTKSAPYALGPAQEEEIDPQETDAAKAPELSPATDQSDPKPEKSSKAKTAMDKPATKMVKGSGAKRQVEDEGENPTKDAPAKVIKPKAIRTKEKDATRP